MGYRFCSQLTNEKTRGIEVCNAEASMLQWFRDASPLATFSTIRALPFWSVSSYPVPSDGRLLTVQEF